MNDQLYGIANVAGGRTAAEYLIQLGHNDRILRVIFRHNAVSPAEGSGRILDSLASSR
jgi:DNA-binding LacI/PurR family transcriptional regulator